MEDKAMLESNLSAIWGFAGEWCLVGTAPFLHLTRDVWYSQNITPLVKPSVKLRVWAEPRAVKKEDRHRDLYGDLGSLYCLNCHGILQDLSGTPGIQPPGIAEH